MECIAVFWNNINVSHASIIYNFSALSYLFNTHRDRRRKEEI
jgi:hypothetical protein